MRPLWPGSSPAGLHDWRPLAGDLARFLDQRGLSGVFGAGHSMGATTTLRLALRQPDRFKALALVDPVFFPPRMALLWDLVYRLGLAGRALPLARRALWRKPVFEDKAAMFANYRSKAVFAGLSDAGLHAYVDALASPLPDGRVGLAYPPQWEARIYITG